jgi:hypothetical protein
METTYSKKNTDQAFSHKSAVNLFSLFWVPIRVVYYILTISLVSPPNTKDITNTKQNTTGKKATNYTPLKSLKFVKKKVHETKNKH